MLEGRQDVVKIMWCVSCLRSPSPSCSVSVVGERMVEESRPPPGVEDPRVSLSGGKGGDVQGFGPNILEFS